MSIFYEENIDSNRVVLSEEESKHCSQVLRKQVGEAITVLDGKGNSYQCILTEVSKRRCLAQVQEISTIPRRGYRFHLAIAPTKNTDRMEWMLEKLCEIGIDELTLLQTKHSERKKIRLDRLERKAVSALKQSGNGFLPKLNPIISMHDFLSEPLTGIKLIAHVDKNHPYLAELVRPKQDVTILVGPEGDFSEQEVREALQIGFHAVSLGTSTLRTETAGLKACCFLSIVNQC